MTVGCKRKDEERLANRKVKQTKKKASFFSTLTLIFFLVGLVLLIVAFMTSRKSADAVSIPSIPTAASATLSGSNNEVLVSVVDLPSENPEESSASESTDGGSTVSRIDLSGVAVQASAEQPLSYLDNAVFLGDSITEGMDMYNQSNGTVVAYKGLTTKGALGEALPKYNDKTAVQAVAAAHPAKIYVMFGSNEIAGVKLETFKENYDALIDALREKSPDAIIYIQTIPPVTATYSGEGHYLNNGLINEANETIAEVAQEKGVYLLDVHGALVDESGALPSDASPIDGVHFGKTTYEKWFTYLLTHTV